mmetsp:Transcript_27916/g.42549  ORF Transcript_27916/g.42549 Transcript_27916/m.42549 type:complete len:293 (+) Transcript_27916:165-1043(+)
MVILHFDDADDHDAASDQRMEARRRCPKIKRRKKRSRVSVNPIIENSITDDEDLIFAWNLSKKDVYCRFEESTARIQEATDNFVDAAELLLSSGETPYATVGDIFYDESYSISSEIKDAIDEGFSGLNQFYDFYLYHGINEELDLRPLAEHMKALLLAYLALPPLITNFSQVASFCNILVQHCGRGALTSDEHAVALFYNVIRYLGEDRKEILERLHAPVKVFFQGKQTLLSKLRFSSSKTVHAIDACRCYDSKLHSLLTEYEHIDVSTVALHAANHPGSERRTGLIFKLIS